MRLFRLVVSLIPLCWLQPSAAGAQEMCSAVAARFWSAVAAGPLKQQTPLDQLTAAAPNRVKVSPPASLAKPGEPVADTLSDQYAAPDALVHTLRDMPPTETARFGDGPVWLMDRVDGTLGCHTMLAVAVPADAPAHEIALPGNPDPSKLCGLSALNAVTIDDTPALWIEQSGAFSNSVADSTVMLAPLHGEAFGPSCTLTIDYTVTDTAGHAFCDGIDCVPLIRTAEILAMRLRNGETAGTFGDGVVASDDPEESAAWQHMQAIAAGTGDQPMELPTFGVSLDTPYVALTGVLVFPLRLADGHLYLARIGHGGFGWRQSPDTLLAVYRLKDNRLEAAASVYVAAKRTGIAAITVK